MASQASQIARRSAYAAHTIGKPVLPRINRSGGFSASTTLRMASAVVRGSPSAPAYHFGSTKGLLTEVALLAYGRVDQHLECAGHPDDPVQNICALSLAFVTFAVDHPGHFRLMFRNDLVNRDDPRHPSASRKPGARLRGNYAGSIRRSFLP